MTGKPAFKSATGDLTVFKKILVANRGAVAARIIRAARQMGIDCAVVYSEADADLPYVRQAEEKICIGPPAAADSYLNMDKILAAAQSASVDAIHPGYGFLSENAEFAARAQRAGLVFIGPSPHWIESMGHKTRARELMAQHNMPMCRSSGILQGTAEQQCIQAASAGFPLLIKPAAGGGGIGMIAVHEASALPAALEQATSLAQRSFGNSQLYAERLFAQPRHIEFQIMADNFGNAMHLFERDCSIQRRHQKVIEEAGAPAIDRATLVSMADTAVRIMENVKYNNIGTVETLYDQQTGFSFLEMNTRLQVEHGVTEAVTGIDIVQSQIALAAGKRLHEVIPNRPQAPIGHAIQVRIYAEDPWRFTPSPGLLSVFRLGQGAGIRIETGYAEGTRVSPFYDPMIAKVIAHGDTRRQAIERLRSALSDSVIEGIKTNIPFLLAALEYPDFCQGQVHTQLAQNIVTQAAPDRKRPLAA
ncbi:acetyl-CoA carboxylase biotin carboxylase subunit [Advenella incenata]|jgi:acetyl-CoA carboxylase biotin carboxylase subunit|uniref:Acetyl-CoA carboxylase biotin carboxylase subunit n=1 Tax=Advenella incenata TaxID=267800 RepID=A0A4Q7VSX8_9BURK|nr:acetyl-CoA carboxylase biotin carboxylase subunit [Advenella incenata]